MARRKGRAQLHPSRAGVLAEPRSRHRLLSGDVVVRAFRIERVLPRDRLEVLEDGASGGEVAGAHLQVEEIAVGVAVVGLAVDGGAKLPSGVVEALLVHGDAREEQMGRSVIRRALESGFSLFPRLVHAAEPGQLLGVEGAQVGRIGIEDKRLVQLDCCGAMIVAISGEQGGEIVPVGSRAHPGLRLDARFRGGGRVEVGGGARRLRLFARRRVPAGGGHRKREQTRRESSAPHFERRAPSSSPRSARRVGRGPHRARA